MDCIVHGVSKSLTRLSDVHFSSYEMSWEYDGYMVTVVNSTELHI